ncbi:iron ABC transporter permease [Sphingobacterium sp. E70]|uniref:iron ABC transporter permease n=1 Tax=Sphingobacterium sp. E70 TaxID=2853439 RepID=UPI00211CC070|nr:iron ABC transporter permease [Sphingobacterium sp. E70]
MQKKQKLILLALSLILFITCIVALGLGAYHIPAGDILSMLMQKLHLSTAPDQDSMQTNVLFEIRMPRLLLGLLVGAALGISGAAIQGIFRNPLAEPGLIGISSGASLFAVLIIAFETFLLTSLSAWIGYYILALGAFVGAGLTAFWYIVLPVKMVAPM